MHLGTFIPIRSTFTVLFLCLNRCYELCLYTSCVVLKVERVISLMSYAPITLYQAISHIAYSRNKRFARFRAPSILIRMLCDIYVLMLLENPTTQLSNSISIISRSGPNHQPPKFLSVGILIPALLGLCQNRLL